MSEKRENYDLLTAVIICLGHSEDEKYAGVLKLLGVLLSSEEAAFEKKKILQDEFDIKMTRELESEVSRVCNLSKGVWERGMRKGMEEGFLASVQNLMESMGWSVEQAMQALRIPEAEQPIYRDNLKAGKK